MRVFAIEPLPAGLRVQRGGTVLEATGCLDAKRHPAATAGTDARHELAQKAPW